MAGLLLSFEGTDGSGKTTQIEALRDYLLKSGEEVSVFREPGGSVISEAIRSVLLDRAHSAMQAETELLLYTASRLQLLGEKILPALAQGQVVLLDRFADSTTAYQGFGRQLSLRLVEKLNGIVREKAWPRRTWWLDLAPEDAERRTDKRGEQKDRMEAQEREFFKRVRQGYQRIAAQEGTRVLRLDAALGVAELAQLIREDFQKLRRIET